MCGWWVESDYSVSSLSEKVSREKERAWQFLTRLLRMEILTNFKINHRGEGSVIWLLLCDKQNHNLQVLEWLLMTWPYQIRKTHQFFSLGHIEIGRVKFLLDLVLLFFLVNISSFWKTFRRSLWFGCLLNLCSKSDYFTIITSYWNIDW